MAIFEKHQRQIIMAAREFAKGMFNEEQALTYDKNQVFPMDIYREAAKLGFLGMHINEDLGGGGFNYFETAVVAMTLSSVDSTFGIATMYPSLFIFHLNREFVDGKSGLCVFLIPINDRIEIFHESKGLGWSMIPRYTVRLNGVFVDEKSYLGKGFFSLQDLKRFLISELILMASLGVGISEGSIEKALNHVKLRKQFNRKLVEFPVVRKKISEMYAKLSGARSLTYEVALDLSNEKNRLKVRKMNKLFTQALCAKYVSACAAKEVSDQAIQLLGGYGYMREYHVERFYRDAKCLELYGGDKYKLKELIFKGVN